MKLLAFLRRRGVAAPERADVEYGVTCGRVGICDRPRGHDGDHGAWVLAGGDLSRPLIVDALELEVAMLHDVLEAAAALHWYAGKFDASTNLLAALEGSRERMSHLKWPEHEA